MNNGPLESRPRAPLGGLVLIGVELQTLSGEALVVDRDRELARLAASLEAAARGEGSVTVISGAAGVGKSTLLAAAAERGRDLGPLVRGGCGSELEHELSFGVVRQLFEQPLHSASPEEGRRLLSGAAAATERLFADAPLDHAATDDGGFATLHGPLRLGPERRRQAGRDLRSAVDLPGRPERGLDGCRCR